MKEGTVRSILGVQAILTGARCCADRERTLSAAAYPLVLTENGQVDGNAGAPVAQVVSHRKPSIIMARTNP